MKIHLTSNIFYYPVTRERERKTAKVRAHRKLAFLRKLRVRRKLERYELQGRKQTFLIPPANTCLHSCVLECLRIGQKYSCRLSWRTEGASEWISMSLLSPARCPLNRVACRAARGTSRRKKSSPRTKGVFLTDRPRYGAHTRDCETLQRNSRYHKSSLISRREIQTLLSQSRERSSRKNVERDVSCCTLN